MPAPSKCAKLACRSVPPWKSGCEVLVFRQFFGGQCSRTVFCLFAWGSQNPRKVRTLAVAGCRRPCSASFGFGSRGWKKCCRGLLGWCDICDMGRGCCRSSSAQCVRVGAAGLVFATLGILAGRSCRASMPRRWRGAYTTSHAARLRQFRLGNMSASSTALACLKVIQTAAGRGRGQKPSPGT